jgi:hypothetical protein
VRGNQERLGKYWTGGKTELSGTLAFVPCCYCGRHVFGLSVDVTLGNYPDSGKLKTFGKYVGEGNGKRAKSKQK